MKYLMLAFIAGCGVTAHVDPITTEPIKVTHTIVINFDAAFAYCDTLCGSKNLDPTATQACSQECYVNFLTILANAIK